MTYRLICDSCTDLTAEMLQEPHTVKVALTIHVGPDTIVDDESFDQQNLLKKMRAWPDAPKTACPSPDQYMSRFLDHGDNYIVTLSGALSGSYNAAVQAKTIYQDEGGKGNVHVFNSRSASSGQVQVALLIRELADSGLPFGQVVEQVETFIDRMKTLFVLETLDNLRKNGRLTKVQSLVTGSLRIKLLMAATVEGEIMKLGQGFTMRQALNKMISHAAGMASHVGRRLVISHCNCQERAEEVMALARKHCRFGEILITATAGISTVYANDGGIVIAF